MAIAEALVACECVSPAAYRLPGALLTQRPTLLTPQSLRPQKHYGLVHYVPQNNNFVVFDAFFNDHALQPATRGAATVRPQGGAAAHPDPSHLHKGYPGAAAGTGAAAPRYGPLPGVAPPSGAYDALRGAPRPAGGVAEVQVAGGVGEDSGHSSLASTCDFELCPGSAGAAAGLSACACAWPGLRG